MDQIVCQPEKPLTRSPEAAEQGVRDPVGQLNLGFSPGDDEL